MIPADVLQVLRLRQTALRITGSKLNNALASVCPDGRLRDMHVYHAAHTGRWAGRRFQTQNLTKGIAKFDTAGMLSDPLTWDRVERAAEVYGATPDDVLSTLLRPTLHAKPGHVLLIADYNAIECRGVAWVAGEEKLLDVFRSGGDPYLVTGRMIFGRTITKEDVRERFLSKECTLGSGYGLSGPKFALYCANKRINLAAAGVTADHCIEAYRSAYPAIAGTVAGDYKGRPYRRGGIWHKYADAVMGAVRDGLPSEAGRCYFERDGSSLVVTLPSSRRLTYRKVRIEDTVPLWGGKPRPSVVYTGPRGDRVLWHGAITENIVQAICRDLLAAALIRCEASGLCPVLHVHDEICCEVPHETMGSALRALCETMSEPPAWAEGFPLAVEAHASPRYVKSKWPGHPTCEARNGKAV